MKSALLLEKFTEYCELHPLESFWQALRNWSDVEYILAVGLQGNTEYRPSDEITIENHDTFKWGEWKNRAREIPSEGNRETREHRN